MAKPNPYRDQMKQDFERLIEETNLGEPQKHFLRARWLDQLLYAESKADQARDRYHGLRMMTIVGGVIIPALVSLGFSCGSSAATTVRYSTVGLSLLVAISAGVEELFNYGERWRHFRQTAEWLKIEGWNFLLRTGPYGSHQDHAGAYPIFAERVEEILQRDVGQYFGKVLQQDESQRRTQAE